MKTSEAERTYTNLPATDVTTVNDPGYPQAPPAPDPSTTPSGTSSTKPCITPPASRKKSLATISRTDWPLPPPISEIDPTPAAVHHKPAVNTINLSRHDLETLTALQERCKDMGVKVRKNQLLALSLQLLASTPPGKLLSLLGPLEHYDDVLKRKKKKAPSA